MSRTLRVISNFSGHTALDGGRHLYEMNVGTRMYLDSGPDENTKLTKKEAAALIEEIMAELIIMTREKIRVAANENDTDLVKDLQDFLFGLMTEEIHIKNSSSNGIDTAETNIGFLIGRDSDGVIQLQQPNQVETEYYMNNLNSQWLSGDPLSFQERENGYLLDIPAGREGLRQLIVHEMSHVVARNSLDSNGQRRLERELEVYAECFTHGYLELPTKLPAECTKL